MIAADTSVLIDYFKGTNNEQTIKVDDALTYHALVLPPIVLTELLSDPKLPNAFITYLLDLPILELQDNYWQRAGQSRSVLIQKKLKARLTDTLIAQSCIDHQIPLITNDGDFKHFSKHCGLVLL